MRELSEILAALKDTEATANIEPRETDPRVRAGTEALVRNAKADLERLYTEYKDTVINNVVVIAVKGKTAAEFAASAAKLGAVPVDFDLISERLATNLSKRAVGDIYTSDAHFKLLDELAKIRIEYDIVRLPNPQINAYNDGIYNSALRPAIDKLLLKNYGTSLQSAVSRREIGKHALESRFGGKKLPVVLYNLTGDVDTQFLPAPVTTIVSDGKVTDNSVKKKLTEIRSLLAVKKEGTEAETEPETETDVQEAQTQEGTT